MAIIPSKHIPIKGADFDVDNTRLLADKARYIKNLVDLNSDGIYTPMEGSILQNGAMVKPSGDSIPIGCLESEQTNELYVACWNSQQNHFIYRIRGIDGVAEMVYQSRYLNYQLDPKHFLGNVGRMELISEPYVDRVTGETLERKYLLTTDYFNDQLYISVEDSIATNSFDPVAFPRFLPIGVPVGTEYQVPRDLIKLGVPTPMGCVGITPITPLPADIKKQNLMLHKGWQFRVKHIDVFGRESEHGPISDRYFTILGSACLSSANGLPRCVRLNIPAGGPLVAKIQVEFRTCSGGTTDSDWHLYDIFDKYDMCDNIKWYQRVINNPYAQAYIDAHTEDPSLNDNQIENLLANNGVLHYKASNNTFDYTFCANKMGGLLPATETLRLQNPLPLRSSSLFRINRGIGLANNVRGFEPLHCDVLKKISFSVEAPENAECDDAIYRTIIMYGAVWNIETGVLTGIDLSAYAAGNYTFGANGTAALNGHNNYVHDQGFPEFQSGWVGYLAGTSYYAVSEQIIRFLDDGSEVVEDPQNPIPPSFVRDYIRLQRWTITNVPPGKYVFRISSHRSKPSDDYQKTSTYAMGNVAVAPLITGSPSISTLAARKEFDVNCCSGDVTQSDTVLVIGDLTNNDPTNTSNPPYGNQKVFSAYFREDYFENRPIELAALTITPPGGGSPKRYLTPYTDHNGFLFGYVDISTTFANSRSIGAIQYTDCDTVAFTYNIFGLDTVGTLPQIPVPIIYAVIGQVHYPAINRRLVTGHVKLCDQPLVGVPGALIVSKNGPTVKTDVDGNFKLVLHRRTGAWASDGDVIVYSQSGGTCILYKCNDCDSCFDDVAVPYKACNATPNRNTAVADLSVRIRGAGKSGPKNGGRYRGGIILHDWMGRQGFAQSDESHYLNVPSLIDIQQFDFSTFHFSIDASIVFPSWVRRISFCMTKNLNWEDDFMWIADKVKYVDGAGNENTANPTQVQIYYESLLQYSKANNYATNANWQAIVTEDGIDKSVLGDTVQFIRNGNGTWFDRDVTKLVRYDTGGKYFTVDYSAELDNLKTGLLFKFIRPKQFTTEDLFFELCPIIDVLPNGKPAVLTGQLPYADSYLMARQVPIPEEHIDPNDSTKTIRDVFIRNTSFFFEHTSPSDLWGDHCQSGGRVTVRNPHERQYHQTSEIALSKAIVGSSTFNGLNYFDLAAVTIFDEQVWGAITLALSENTTVLVLCEHDNFVVGFNDSIPRVEGGNLVVGSQPDKFGPPQRKIGMNNGCQMEDIMTVQKRYGMVIFLDKANAKLIFHSFSSSEDASRKIGFEKWLMAKVAAMEAYAMANPDMLAYFVGGIDPRTKTYFFTNIRIKKDGSGQPVGGYVNQLHEPDVTANETIGIHLPSLTLRSFSFTPLMYGTLERFYKSNTVFAMQGASAWSLHNGYENPAYNNFFGIQCKKVFTVVTNLGNEKEKHFLYFELYCKEHLFVAEVVRTESGQVSRVKRTYIQKADTFYKAEYLCAINTPADPNLPAETGVNAIVDGDLLYGRWLETRFISEDVDDAKYCELSAVVNYVITAEKSAI